METVQQNGRFTFFSSKFHSNIFYSLCMKRFVFSEQSVFLCTGVNFPNCLVMRHFVSAAVKSDYFIQAGMSLQDCLIMSIHQMVRVCSIRSIFNLPEYTSKTVLSYQHQSSLCHYILYLFRCRPSCCHSKTHF